MTLTVDLSPAEEAALRELAEAPADVRAAALAEAQRVLRRGANGDSGTTKANGQAEHPGEDAHASAAALPLTARDVLAAPPDVREAALQANARVAAEYYASSEGQAEWEELAAWRALDGEDFYGFEEEDAEAERLRAERKAA